MGSRRHAPSKPHRPCSVMGTPPDCNMGARRGVKTNMFRVSPGVYIWRRYLFLLVSGILLMPASSQVCPSSCTCKPESVHCENDKERREIPQALPASNTLQTLVITGSKIQTIPTSSFDDYTSLRTLDLNNNQIDTVADEAFRNVSTLETLVLRRNPIRKLTELTFIGLRRLEVLELSYNCLLELGDDWFNPLNQLRHLDLARNEIERVNNRAFRGMDNLLVLNLTRNKLIFISPDFFRHMQSLQWLNLEDNNITIVMNNSFLHLPALRAVSFTGNPELSLLPDHMFGARHDNLQKLSLKGTMVKEVPLAVLTTVPRLTSLDLSQTDIRRLDNGSFTSLASLVNLTLEALDNLNDVQPEAFAGLGQLQRLALSHNPLLKLIPPGLLRGLSSLHHLDLSHNAIQTLSQDAADWTSIHTLDFRGNPLRCDCHAAWLLSLLHPGVNLTSPDGAQQRGKHSAATTRSKDYDEACLHQDQLLPQASTSAMTGQAVCQFPAAVKGRCLASLSARDFECTGTSEPRSQSVNNEHRFKVGLLAAGVVCVTLLLCGLGLKYRRRLCSFCRRQYRYKAHRNKSFNGQSVTAQIVEMESTQLDDLDSDIDTTMTG